MKLTLLVVGRNRGVLEAAVREFETRAERYWKLEIIEVASGVGGNADEDRVMAAEAVRLRDRIPEGSELWVLTREGGGMSSLRFAETLGDRMVGGGKGVTFLIGGAHGVAPDLARTADRTFSLSPLTLPHSVARLVLAEQLYRAGTILRGEPYHKGAS